MPLFGLPLVCGRASHGGVNGLTYFCFPIFIICMLGLRLEMLSSTLIPISLACLSLKLLPFLVNQRTMLLVPLMGGDTKQFFKGVNDVLKVANNKTAAPKCLRVIDSNTGSPSQGIVQEKQAFRQHFPN